MINQRLLSLLCGFRQSTTNPTQIIMTFWTAFPKSSVVTVLVDESTDIANVKRFDIYTQIISEEMKPSTHYVTNIKCTDSTGVGIANEIMSEFHKRGVASEKIMSLGSDGASVMTGKQKGL